MGLVDIDYLSVVLDAGGLAVGARTLSSSGTTVNSP
jgi:hypothetical protein